jgi:DNA polymerase-4
MADDGWRWCESRQASGRTVTVKVKFGDFQQITRSRSRPAAVATQESLRRSALDLIRSVVPAKKGIRLVGVAVSNFAEAQAVPPSELPIFAQVAA